MLHLTFVTTTLLRYVAFVMSNVSRMSLSLAEFPFGVPFWGVHNNSLMFVCFC